MKTTTHTCDRCGKTGPGYGDGAVVLRQIEIVVASHHMIAADWCEACTSSQITGWPVDNVRPDPMPEPTVDDIIRQIVQEEIDES